MKDIFHSLIIQVRVSKRPFIGRILIIPVRVRGKDPFMERIDPFIGTVGINPFIDKTGSSAGWYYTTGYYGIGW